MQIYYLWYSIYIFSDAQLSFCFARWYPYENKTISSVPLLHLSLCWLNITLSCTNISFHASVWLQVRFLTLWCAWFWQHAAFPSAFEWVMGFVYYNNFSKLPSNIILQQSYYIRSFCKSFPCLKAQSFITECSRFYTS